LRSAVWLLAKLVAEFQSSSLLLAFLFIRTAMSKLRTAVKRPGMQGWPLCCCWEPVPLL
jgi:hypothetical protein